MPSELFTGTTQDRAPPRHGPTASSRARLARLLVSVRPQTSRQEHTPLRGRPERGATWRSRPLNTGCRVGGRSPGRPRGTTDLLAWGENWGKDTGFEMDMYTLLYLKRITNKVLLYKHRELCSMLCGSLDGRGVRGRMDACVCLAESLCCPPETMATLLIGLQFSSSRSVVSDSLRPHESQHARPPCLSPTPGVHSDSRPSSQ